MTYLIALLICVTAAAFEGLCAGRDPMGALRATQQPSWSPPGWAWILIGIGWYAICYVGLVRLLPFWPDRPLAVLLLTALMLANGAANFFAFRLKRLDLAFAFFLPYWLLLASFFWAAYPMDRLTCALFAIYAVYQIYAALWAHALWKMNRPGA